MQTQTVSPLANFPSAITAFLRDLINYRWCLGSTVRTGEGLGEDGMRKKRLNIRESGSQVVAGIRLEMEILGGETNDNVLQRQ